jgi:hypothetical protein
MYSVVLHIQVGVQQMELSLPLAPLSWESMNAIATTINTRLVYLPEEVDFTCLISYSIVWSNKMARPQSPNAPTRTSTRTPKPSARKHP